MKSLLAFITLVLTFSISAEAQVVSIATAKGMSVGSTVTVRGIATTGSELGTIRFMQDGTAGVAVYDPDLSNVNRGDSIEVTGELTEFNDLLEISNVSASNLSIISSGNTVPSPNVQSLANGFTEQYEGQLMKFNTVQFLDQGNFVGQNNYNVIVGGDTGEVRIDGFTNLVNTPIPTGPVDIVGVLGQYFSTYQVFPRDLNDIIYSGNSPVFSTSLAQSNISKTGFTVSFETLNNGTTVVFYGSNSSFGAVVSDNTQTTSHSIDISNLLPGSIYYVRGLSVSTTNDSSWSAVQLMATESNSTGNINVYFNHTVDNSVASGQDAVYVNGTFADTIKAYIAKATETLDIAIYNIDNDNGIADAINTAYNNGVQVRVLTDEGANAGGYAAINVGSGNKKQSPTGNTPTGGFYGIMHNKFLIVDAHSLDQDKSYVLSGSTNWTDVQLSTDANNIIVVQDQSLAKAYQLEFEEMWNGDFGSEKTNNTPHEFKIGGKRVECYFSPSDNTEEEIKAAINSATQELYFAIFTYTRYTISYEIEDIIAAHNVHAAGMVDDTTGGGGRAYETIYDDMYGLLMDSRPGIMHHKFMLVDPNQGHDPLVLTGSHNWSNSARLRNDENTLIVHDGNIANQYYQAFRQLFLDNGGGVNVFVDDQYAESLDVNLYPNPTDRAISVQLNSKTESLATIQIHGMNGLLVHTSKKLMNPGQNNVFIELGNLESGIYTVTLETAGQRASQQVVIGQ